MSEITKGEWKVNTGIRKGEAYFYAIFNGIEKICEIQEPQVLRNPEKCKANAQLIAHAPQMLDILKQIDYTLSVHGKVDAGTNLHIRLAELIQQATTIK